MSREVYANEKEIVAASADGRVVAAFPDVCLSPPPPPTGPLPVPYPNSSFSRDLKEGSKSVRIKGKPAGLRDQSYYKTSPLGDEAATRNFGANQIVHITAGKTFFSSWSNDVYFEGLNVTTHRDITTSNHASYPAGNSVVSPNLSKQQSLALDRLAEGLCPCCAGPKHNADDTHMSADEWYEHNNPTKIAEVRSLLTRARARAGCTCQKKTRVMPSPPCDVFFKAPSTPAQYRAQKDAIMMQWKRASAKYRRGMGIPREADMMSAALAAFRTQNGGEPGHKSLKRIKTSVRKQRQINHLTPKSAGGCPASPQNLQPHGALCAACQAIDDDFSAFQSPVI